MKKRSCNRFSIPGVTIYYRAKPYFFLKGKYSQDYFPVINLSKGGAKFLCHQRLTPGKCISIKLNIPGSETAVELLADIRWISKNPEQSYKYQTGISFKSFGSGRSENSMEALNFLEGLETRAGELNNSL